MKLYLISICLENDAFADGAEGTEVCRILADLAQQNTLRQEAVTQTLRDINGQFVGEAKRIADGKEK